MIASIRRTRAVPVLGLLAACLLSGLAASAFPAARSSVLLCLTIAAILVLPLVYRVLTRTFDPFDPLLVFTLGWMVVWVVHPLAMIESDHLSVEYSFTTISLADTMQRALWLGLLATVCFIGGYASPIGRLLGDRRVRHVAVARDTITLGAIVIGLIGALMFAIFVASAGGIDELLAGRSATLAGNIRNVNGFFFLAPTLMSSAALILLGLGRLRGDWLVLLVGSGFALLLVVRALATGSRGTLLPLVVGIVVLRYVIRGRRPSLVGSLSIVAIGLMLVTVVGATRSQTLRQRESVATTAWRVATSPNHWFDTLAHNEDSSAAADFAAALTVMPSRLPWEYGSATFGDIVQRPVPRSLWPAKPIPPRERIIREMLPREYSKFLAAPEFTPIGIFYLDLGGWGVALGMLSYGIAARAVYEWFKRNRDLLYAQLIFALFVPFIVSAIRDPLADSVSVAVVLFGPIWLLFHAAASRETR